MVDSSLFTEYTRQLTIQQDQILLNYKRCPYSVKISMTDTKYDKIARRTHKYPKLAKQIMAVYGVMQMEVSQYLVVVSKACAVGQIFKRLVFRVDKLQFICLHSVENDIDKTYVEGLTKVLDNQSLYFSIEYDLTQNLQKFTQTQGKTTSPRLEFMYNDIWSQPFMEIGAWQWVTPFISGFITISFVQISNNQSIELCLVTRRDRRRQGLRYLTRGSNQDGETANTCETETILAVEQDDYQQYFSYVQYRGSFPFGWKQDPDLKFTPISKINPDHGQNKSMASKHFMHVMAEYGFCTMVNLVDHKKFQKQLGQYFTQIHEEVGRQNLNLIWFDFHKECSKQKYQNLAKLLDLLSDAIYEYGYFRLQHSKLESNKYYEVKRQRGVIRANCVDCLDRTNVVQSVIGRKMLLKWLAKIKMREPSSNDTAFQQLPGNMEHIFRQQWTANANALSQLYSGTNAMKTDFTKTGRRTISGALKDAKVGVQRYFLGNFYDSRTQDFIHLSLGQIRPHQNEKQKIRHSKLNPLYILTAVAIAIPVIVVAAVEQFASQESNKTAMKVGLIAVSLGVFMKTTQMLKSLIIRKPLPVR